LTAEDSLQGDTLALEMTDSDAEEISAAHLELALRILARLTIRVHQSDADHEANVAVQRESSALTAPRHPSAHDEDEAV